MYIQNVMLSLYCPFPKWNYTITLLSHPSILWWSVFYFLCPWTYLFLVPYLNGILYLPFSIWFMFFIMFSRLTHVIPCFFKLNNTLCIYLQFSSLFFCWWILGFSASVWVPAFSILGIYQEMKLLYQVIILLKSLETSNFSRISLPFYIPTSIAEGYSFSIS
jgi:hypothetical protein